MVENTQVVLLSCCLPTKLSKKLWLQSHASSTVRMSRILFALRFVFVIPLTSCDWVEIPQFSNKRILSNANVVLVTPDPPMIFDYNSGMYSSSYTTTLPMSNEFNLIRPSNLYVEQKKSITKIPDALNRKSESVSTVPSSENIVQLSNKSKLSNKSTNTYQKNTEHSNKSNNKYTEKTNPLPYKEQTDYYEEDEEEYEDDAYVTKDDGEYYEDDEYYDDEDDKSKKKDNGFSYIGILPYLKNIQSTLIRTSHTNTKSKVSLLSNLRDSILHIIQKKIANLFGFKDRQRRSARTDYQYEKEHNSIEFPSSESSLLTIGFLTFAVFLIKMVLKLIHAIKGKESNYMMVAVTTAATRNQKSMGRGAPTDEELKILNVLEGFQNNHK